MQPAPGAFLQAAANAEALMAELIVAALPKKRKRVADLFCGVGAFSFALARHVSVAAYDGDAAAIATLQAAQRHAQGLKPIAARVREMEGRAVDDEVVTTLAERFQWPLVIAAAALVTIPLVAHRGAGRRTGAVLVACYLAYAAWRVTSGA